MVGQERRVTTGHESCALPACKAHCRKGRRPEAWGEAGTGPVQAPGSGGGPAFKETPPCGVLRPHVWAVQCECGSLTTTF